MALSHHGGTEKEQEAPNLHGFPKIERCHEKGSLSFIFYGGNIGHGGRTCSFLDGFLSYHQITIAPEDKYKTAFITYWGTFVWIIMLFGLKNVPPTYQ